MPMHPDFADWYRTVHIEPKAEELQLRWQGVETFQQRAIATDVSNASRLFFGLTIKESDWLPQFREDFKAVDATFSVRDNNAELQVLAGAALACMFTDSDTESTAAALALVCGSCNGNRSAP